jgi:hypothetical protein
MEGHEEALPSRAERETERDGRDRPRPRRRAARSPSGEPRRTAPPSSPASKPASRPASGRAARRALSALAAVATALAPASPARAAVDDPASPESGAVHRGADPAPEAVPVAPDSAGRVPSDARPDDAELAPRDVEVETEPSEDGLPGLARGPARSRSPASAPAGPATWLDTSREAVEGKIGSLAVWLDRFFGTVQYLPLEEPSTYFRLRGDAAWRQVGAWAFGGSVIADVRLPRLTSWSERLSVSLVGGRAVAAPSGAPAEVAAIPLPSLTSPGGALELRYDLVRPRGAVLDLGAGLRFRWPLTPYVRLRWIQAAHVAEPVLLRLSPWAFWERDVGFGLKLEVEANVEVAWATIWKTRLAEGVTQLGRGLEWYAETGVQLLLGPHTAVYPAVSANGATLDPPRVDLSRIFARLRQNLYRMWIFAEVEPEVRWLHGTSGELRHSYGVILRLELQFASLGTGSRWGP